MKRTLITQRVPFARRVLSLPTLRGPDPHHFPSLVGLQNVKGEGERWCKLQGRGRGCDERAKGAAVPPRERRTGRWPSGTARAEAGAGDRPGEGTREEPPGHKLGVVSMACYVPLLLRNNN